VDNNNVLTGGKAELSDTFLFRFPTKTMAENTYTIQYAKTGRAKCKLTACKKVIDSGVLRLGKIFPNPFGDGDQTHWYHPECLFKSFVRAKTGTKKIDGTDNIAGFDKIQEKDQKVITQYIEDSKANKFKAAPIKRKAPDPPKKERTAKKKTETNRERKRIRFRRGRRSNF